MQAYQFIFSQIYISMTVGQSDEPRGNISQAHSTKLKKKIVVVSFVFCYVFFNWVLAYWP